MNRLHEGLDYRIYKVYVFGGFIAIFIYALIMGFTGKIPNTGNEGLVILGFPVTIWVTGILAYWWMVFLFKKDNDLEELLKNPPDIVPEVRSLKSWTTLHTAMSLYGGDIEQFRKMERAGRNPVLIWYGLQNLMVLWIFGCFWAYIFYQDKFPWDIRWIMAYGVIGFLVIFFLATPLLVWLSGSKGEEASFKSLGLEFGQAPQKIKDAIVLEGSRRGRKVRIEYLSKKSHTLVKIQTPPFEIQSQAGKLTTNDNAPDPVVKALKGLRKAKRWIGIICTGGPDGVWIERETTGHNKWLYDLWLIERVLERFEEER
jgi:hypothetical protein